MLAGVCGGVAEYMDLDPTLVRILWVIGTIVTGIWVGVILYVVCMLIMPER